MKTQRLYIAITECENGYFLTRNEIDARGQTISHNPSNGALATETYTAESSQRAAEILLALLNWKEIKVQAK